MKNLATRAALAIHPNFGPSSYYDCPELFRTAELASAFAVRSGVQSADFRSSMNQIIDFAGTTQGATQDNSGHLRTIARKLRQPLPLPLQSQRQTSDRGRERYNFP